MQGNATVTGSNPGVNDLDADGTQIGNAAFNATGVLVGPKTARIVIEG
jgi:hypothetical protein